MSASRGARSLHWTARGRRVLRALGAAALFSLAILQFAGGGASPAAYAPPPPLPQTDDSAPATDIVMLGATPEEVGVSGANETWGIGSDNGSEEHRGVLVRYTEGQGWALGPALPEGFALSEVDPRLASRFTRLGAGVLVGTIGKRKVVLVRSAGGSFQIAPIPGEAEGPEQGSEAKLLGKGEEAFGENRAPLLAPLDEAGGTAGALLAPVQAESAPPEHQILHWDGKRWTSEPIQNPRGERELVQGARARCQLTRRRMAARAARL